MRFHVAGTARAKALPKVLSRTVALKTGSKPSLSDCQAAVAMALGYASFGELLAVAGSGRASASPPDDVVDERERRDRLERQAASFRSRLGLEATLAQAIAREAGLTGRPGRGEPASGATPPPVHVSTHGWPVVYEGAIRELDAAALESFDTVIETLAPGQSATGLPGLVDHLVTGEAVEGERPYIRVRYATAQEVLATFADGDDEEEARDTLDRFCHPSERREGRP